MSDRDRLWTGGARRADVEAKILANPTANVLFVKTRSGGGTFWFAVTRRRKRAMVNEQH